MTNNVALFIDYENIRASLVSLFGREPDPKGLMAKALKHGNVIVANAYTDFAGYSSASLTTFEVAGIKRVDVPPKVQRSGLASRVDMFMLLDIVDTLFDRPNVDTIILMTGDSDFIGVATRLKNRFGKKVVISGVPGSLSKSLSQVGDVVDLLDVESFPKLADLRIEIIRIVNDLDLKWKAPTFTGYRKWLSDPRCDLHLSFHTAHDILDQMVGEGLFIRSQEEIEVEGQKQPSTVTRLNRAHPEVVAALKGA